MNDKSLCNGCHDDFYNDKNPYGIKECWHLNAAVIKTKFEISIDTPMGELSGYKEKRVYNCYSKNGFVYLNEIPPYAK